MYLEDTPFPKAEALWGKLTHKSLQVSTLSPCTAGTSSGQTSPTTVVFSFLPPPEPDHGPHLWTTQIIITYEPSSPEFPAFNTGLFLEYQTHFVSAVCLGYTGVPQGTKFRSLSSWSLCARISSPSLNALKTSNLLPGPCRTPLGLCSQCSGCAYW